jgi:hypothetical protein
MIRRSWRRPISSDFERWCKATASESCSVIVR